MKKMICACTAALFALLGLSACTAIRELPKEAQVQEIKTPEQVYCRELVQSFLKDDAKGFVKRLSPEARERFTEKEFEQTRKELMDTLGKPVSFRYLDTLNFTSLQTHLWVVSFEKELKDGKVVRSEALFRIMAGKDVQGNVLVISFNFL